MGSCQNYDPFLDTLNIRCRIIMGIQKGTIILTTTHMVPNLRAPPLRSSEGLSQPYRSGSQNDCLSECGSEIPRMWVQGLGFEIPCILMV